MLSSLKMYMKLFSFIRNQKVVKRSFAVQAVYTSDIYNVRRGKYNEIEEHHIKFFKNLLGETRITTDAGDLEKYNQEWMRCVRGKSTLALKPKTTQEVSRILSFCNENNLAVCPYGGGTGLNGAATPVFDEIVLSGELMDEILEIDEYSGVAVCQAGCILENLDNKFKEQELMVPLDLGAKGSCHVGGNVATNAGGLRLFRYGNLHGNVTGLEIVTANGNIIDCLNTLKKDNTGYHLKNIFIGSEGTLGFITKVAIQGVPRPKSRSVSYLGLNSYQEVLETFIKAKQDLGEILSAFEVIDTPTMVFVEKWQNASSPIGNYPFYLLIETSGSNEEHDNEKVYQFVEACLNKKLVLNGIVATEPGKINALWSLRERIPDAFKFCGYVFLYDVSLPLENYYVLVNDIREHMGARAENVFGFGHLGDSNLHLQIETKEFTKEIKNHIEPFIFHRTQQLNGSISAEHGMGFLKAPYLNLAKSQPAIELMRSMKQMLDPKGIMNPYKVFPW